MPIKVGFQAIEAQKMIIGVPKEIKTTNIVSVWFLLVFAS